MGHWKDFLLLWSSQWTTCKRLGSTGCVSRYLQCVQQISSHSIRWWAQGVALQNKYVYVPRTEHLQSSIAEIVRNPRERQFERTASKTHMVHPCRARFGMQELEDGLLFLQDVESYLITCEELSFAKRCKREIEDWYIASNIIMFLPRLKNWCQQLAFCFVMWISPGTDLQPDCLETHYTLNKVMNH